MTAGGSRWRVAAITLGVLSIFGALAAWLYGLSFLLCAAALGCAWVARRQGARGTLIWALPVAGFLLSGVAYGTYWYLTRGGASAEAVIDGSFDESFDQSFKDLVGDGASGTNRWGPAEASQ